MTETPEQKPIPAGAVAIPVGERFALIDASDEDRIAAYRWYAMFDKGGTVVYAYTRGSAGIPLYMHRLVIDAPVGIEVDHRNRNGLDNRRGNLRLATRSQNAANRGKPGGYAGRPTSSVYKGVYKHGQCAGWQAKITVDGRRRHLGMFADEADAARAYDAAALAAWGDRARPNFPNEVSS
jgi:hypothetical protein